MRIGLAGLPADDLAWIVQGAQKKADDLRSCTFLVTGASGFVGRWLVASLVEMRRQLDIPTMSIHVLVRDPGTAKDRLGAQLLTEVNVVQADINVPWSIEDPLSHVFHCATPASLRSGSGDNQGGLVTSVLGTANLIQAVGAKTRPPRVLHTSSGAVYGPQPPGLERIPETWMGSPSPYMPTAPYAEGKRAAEALLEDAGRAGLIVPIQARLFAFLGPGLPTTEGFAIGNFMGQASRGQTITVRGDGSTVRSYLDAKEMALWLVLLSLDGEWGTPYNVGSPVGRSLRHWAEQCAAVGGVDVTYGQTALGDRSAYVPEISNSERFGLELFGDNPSAALHSWFDWLQASPA